MLRRTLLLLLAALLTTARLQAAENPFLGEWRLNPAKSHLTDVMKIEGVDGLTFAFNFGSGPETLKVDGTDQPGNFGSTLAVSIESPHSWKIVRKRNGRVTVVATWSLSSDGDSLTDHFTGFKPDGSIYTLVYLYQRKGPGDGFAGEWVSRSETVSSAVTVQVRPYEGEGLSFVDSSTQMTRAARFDGKDYAVSGSNAIPESTCSLQRLDEHTLELTFKVHGRTLYTQKIQLSSDGKTMTMTRHIVGVTEPNIQVFERT